MPIVSFPFDSVMDTSTNPPTFDRAVTSLEMRTLFNTLFTDGYFYQNDNDFFMGFTASGKSASVAPGLAMLGGVFCKVYGNTVVSNADNTGSSNVYKWLILRSRLHSQYRDCQIFIKATSSNNPNLTRNENYYEIALWSWVQAPDQSRSNFTDLRGHVSYCPEVKIPVRMEQEFPVDAIKALAGTGAGAFNSLCFLQDVNYLDVSHKNAVRNGSFAGLHSGMRYTAPSGRKYWLAGADYFYKSAVSQQGTQVHHMVVIPDFLALSGYIASPASTSAGAAGGNFYSAARPQAFTDALNVFKANVLTDFNAYNAGFEIQSFPIYLSNAITGSAPSAYSSTLIDLFQLNASMLTGSPMGLTSGEFFNMGSRRSQLPIFSKLSVSFVAGKDSFWLDDITNAYSYAIFNGTDGVVSTSSADIAIGVKPCFILS